ncbi:MAG: penicillin-binding transpeptidase domain-containing protein, partial [Wenzhouxiangella sp.]
WDAVFTGLEAVVHGPTGTARAVASQMPVRMGGKTGTAQVFGVPDDFEANFVRDHDERPEHLRNHALFIGFAPFDDPAIAISVVVEHGGGGSRIAAPVAAAVLARAMELGY